MKNKKSEKSIKLAAVYIRVSTKMDSQTESYELQLEMLQAKCKLMGYKIFKIYMERITATKVNGRDAFDGMMADAQNKKFEAIFSKDLSRLARNQEISHRMRRIVTENEITIFTIGDGDHVEKDPLMFGFKSLSNESYSEDLSRKIKSSFKSRAKSGLCIQSEAPYGYELKNKILTRREDDTPDNVNFMFDKYIEGFGVAAIANLLTKRGSPTPGTIKGKSNAGVRWHSKSVNYILSNPVYIGTLVQMKEEVISMYSNKRKNTTPIVFENHHEPIVDIAKFELVQLLLKERKNDLRPTPKKHLFTDSLYCGKCGNKMWFRAFNKRYICGAYSRYGTSVCTAISVKEDDLIKIINEDLQIILKDLNINTTSDEDLEKKWTAKQYKNANKKVILVQKIEKLDLAKGKLIVLKAMGDIQNDEYDLAMRALNSQLDEATLSLRAIDLAEEDIDTDASRKKLRDMVKIMDQIDISNPSVLNMLVKKVIVNADEKIEIFYKFKL